MRYLEPFAPGAERFGTRQEDLEGGERPRASIGVVHAIEGDAVGPILFQRLEEERVRLSWVEATHLARGLRT